MDHNLVDIEDIGSLNGTFINGIRLEVNIKRTLKRDEELKLHDESFDLYERKEINNFLNS
jgi:pSer/pThr/pTyr-binding forkhead associated (FHA) protein